METHKIGRIYNVNGRNYKLVKGDQCKDCVLFDKAECMMVPECDQHEGHYINVNNDILLNHNKIETIANFCKKISKQKDCPSEFIEIVNKEFWNLL